jgi:hypothetical protein
VEGGPPEVVIDQFWPRALRVNANSRSCIGPLLASEVNPK